MKFRNLKPLPLLQYLSVGCLYPVFSFILHRGENPMLHLIDAFTVTGAVFIIVGILFTMARHGDFDISEYVLRRTIERKNMKPFKAFREDKQQKREGSFNYPLFTGFLLIAVSAILALFVY